MSKNSAGTKHTNRGAVGARILVDPITGLPVDVIQDSSLIRRLAVDANITDVTIENISVDLDPAEDGVHIGNKHNGDLLFIEPDGSINVNCSIDAADGDNIAISDGTNIVSVTPDNQLCVTDVLKNGGTNSVLTVGTTPVEIKVGATAFSNRKTITAMPLDKGIYFGFKSNVDTTTGVNGGTPLAKKQLLEVSAADSSIVYLVADVAGKKVAITEA